MSGDVQPRKRKDKKRKKEDSTEQIPVQHIPVNTQNDDLNIHVHKEEGTGGGICAKIVFFILFSILAVLIGFIIIENRGLTDLDTVEQESRYSQLFEGWTDSKSDHADHDDHIVSSLEEEEHLDDDHDEEDDETEHGSEEDQLEDEEEASEETAPISEEDEAEDDDEIEASEETPITEEEEDEEEEPNVSPEEEEEEPNVSQDEDEEPNVSPEEEEEEEEPNVSQDEDEEIDTAVSEEKDDQAPEEEPEVEEHQQEEPEPEESDTQNSKMVVKIGVGVALLVVAHVVLVRKWKTATPPEEKDETTTPDLSRRNTIVVPPTFEQIEHDIEPQEEFSEDESEQTKASEMKYEELRTTYTRSLTPDSENRDEEEEYEEEEEDEEEEEIEEEEEEESDEKDDDDLLKRLEARYGKLAKDEEDDDFSSWKRVNVGDDNELEQSESDVEYEYEGVTDKDDLKKLNEAQENIQDNPAYAIKLFDVLLHKYPSSTRSLYGKAQALDSYADQKRSNEMLQKALEMYMKLLKSEHVSNKLFQTVAQRCINRMRFLGNYFNAIDVHKKLIARFPNVTDYKNQLAISYLTINRIYEARKVLEQILFEDPNDGVALVHYGFILKTIDNNLSESIIYLKKGLATKAQGVIDGRFYFHLGDALARLGQTKEAMQVHEDGVREKVFLSKYQRSLYNVARLKAQPLWRKTELPYSDLFKALQSNWEKIRAEGLAVLNKDGLFQKEAENLKDTGEWKQFELFARGFRNEKHCKKCPFTCKLIEAYPEARSCKRGQTKFSVMHPGTHVWPHCGPTNCRLRIHLGLQVPAQTHIRVADKMGTWKNGELLIFDDSFEHEVWHNGTSVRLVLIVDVWHPELTATERKALSAI